MMKTEAIINQSGVNNIYLELLPHGLKDTTDQWKTYGVNHPFRYTAISYGDETYPWLIVILASHVQMYQTGLLYRATTDSPYSGG